MPRTGLTKQVYYSLSPQYRRIAVVISRLAKVSRLSHRQTTLCQWGLLLIVMFFLAVPCCFKGYFAR